MADITSVSIGSLLKTLNTDYPDFHFSAGNEFRFTPPDNISYIKANNIAAYLLLHEVGHALCNHKTFSRDIELVTLEMQAWEKARELASTYGIVIPDDTIQSSLDTYRDWLHSRSTCPTCHSTGMQETSSPNYRCLACNKTWRVSPNQTCVIRRQTQK